MRCSHAVEDKRLLRASVLAARDGRSAEQRRRDERSIAGHVLAHYGAARVVTAYASVGSEPPTRRALEQLRIRGARVLLPVVDGGELAWGELGDWDHLRPGPHGLLQPPADAAAAEAAVSSDVTLVPALAVARDGTRLGRGGGYFDRWLAEVGHAGRLVVAVVYDDEVVEALPREPHDITVRAAVTPSGVVQLSRQEESGQ
jgi:5-formyltetrahydrofolate cyclo-ligase